MASWSCRQLKPSHQVLNHFAKQQLFESFASSFMRHLETALVVAVNRRLPEKLDEPREVQSVVIVRLEQFLINLGNHQLEFVLVKHCMVHVVLSKHLHKVDDRYDFLVALSALGRIAADWVLLGGVFVEQETEQSRVLLEHETHAVFLTIFFGAGKVNQDRFLFASSCCYWRRSDRQITKFSLWRFDVCQTNTSLWTYLLCQHRIWFKFFKSWCEPWIQLRAFLLAKDSFKFLLSNHRVTLQNETSLGHFKLSLWVKSFLLLLLLCLIKAFLVLLLNPLLFGCLVLLDSSES